MSVVVVVQARVGSTRLPGKVLMPLHGRPMLAFMLERIRPLEVGPIVVATSVAERDDAIEHVARDAGVEVIRGPEQDVLSRFGSAVRAFPADDVVRLTADCPLTDPRIVAAALDRHIETAADYTSNTLERTFPDGLDVEVVTQAAILEADREARDPAEREHVTPFVYRRPDRYRLASLVSGDDLGAERWTVDTPEDLDRIRTIVEQLADPLTAGWREVLAVAGRTSGRQ